MRGDTEKYLPAFIIQARSRLGCRRVETYLDIMVSQTPQRYRDTEPVKHLRCAGKDMEGHYALRLDLLLAYHRQRRMGRTPNGILYLHGLLAA